MNSNPHAGSDTARRLMLREYFPATFLVATIGWCGFIFYLSSQPTPQVPSPPHFDKVVHFCVFGFLAGMIALGMSAAEYKYSVRVLILAPITYTFLYGLSDEIHQLFVESRSFEVADLVANLAGAVMVTCLIFVVLRRMKLGM